MATLYALGRPDDPHIAKELKHVRALGCEAVPVASWTPDPCGFHEASWSPEEGWTLAPDRAFWFRNKHQVGTIASAEKQQELWSYASIVEMFRSAGRLGPLCFNVSAELAATDNKIAQLEAARRAGFRIPETIVSNRKADILAFLEREQSCIVKPIHSLGAPAINGDPETARFIPTLPITAEHIRTADADAVRIAPSIYQRLVPKAYELRTVVFAAETVSFRLESQSHPYTALDWRAGELITPCERVDTPAELIAPIQAYLAATGLTRPCLTSPFGRTERRSSLSRTPLGNGSGWTLSMATPSARCSRGKWCGGCWRPSARSEDEPPRRCRRKFALGRSCNLCLILFLPSIVGVTLPSLRPSHLGSANVSHPRAGLK